MSTPTYILLLGVLLLEFTEEFNKQLHLLSVLWVHITEGDSNDRVMSSEEQSEMEMGG